MKIFNVSSFSWTPHFKEIVHLPLNVFKRLARYDPPNHEDGVQGHQLSFKYTDYVVETKLLLQT